MVTPVLSGWLCSRVLICALYLLKYPLEQNSWWFFLCLFTCFKSGFSSDPKILKRLLNVFVAMFWRIAGWISGTFPLLRCSRRICASGKQSTTVLWLALTLQLQVLTSDLAGDGVFFPLFPNKMSPLRGSAAFLCASSPVPSFKSLLSQLTSFHQVWWTEVAVRDMKFRKKPGAGVCPRDPN